MRNRLIWVQVASELGVEGQVLYEALGPRTDPRHFVLVELIAVEDASEPRSFAGGGGSELGIPTRETGNFFATGVLDGQAGLEIKTF